MMTTPFGPQLIGEAEKTLDAILRTVLHGTGLNESQWVTLRLASEPGHLDHRSLVATVADRAHFTDAEQLVDQLTERGLVEGGQLATDGRDLLESVQTVITETTAPIWNDLAADDVIAAERLLHEIIHRSRRVLATRQ